jgi:hypothetical protein
MDKEINNSADVLDVRDVIARYEELESDLQNAEGNTEVFEDWIEDTADDERHHMQDDAVEFIAIRAFLAELCGNGGDEQWRGDWYPVTLVRESYFKTYAQELAEDIGAIPDNAQWPCTCIDWEQAARELRMDYAGADFDGVTYYAR